MTRFAWVLCVVLSLAWLGSTSQAAGAAKKKHTTGNKSRVRSGKSAKRTRHSASRTAHSASTRKSKAKESPKVSSSRKGSKSRRHGKKAASSRRGVGSQRAGQLQPAPERYKQIQQALIDKGYLHGAATGEWGPDSIEALKRFQKDQNLEPDGKIGALSLIALGLGSKKPLPPTGISIDLQSR